MHSSLAAADDTTQSLHEFRFPQVSRHPLRNGEKCGLASGFCARQENLTSRALLPQRFSAWGRRACPERAKRVEGCRRRMRGRCLPCLPGIHVWLRLRRAAPLWLNSVRAYLLLRTAGQRPRSGRFVQLVAMRAFALKLLHEIALIAFREMDSMEHWRKRGKEFRCCAVAFHA